MYCPYHLQFNFFIIFLLNIFLTYISNVILFSDFPSANPSYPPSPCFYEGAPPPVGSPSLKRAGIDQATTEVGRPAVQLSDLAGSFLK